MTGRLIRILVCVAFGLMATQASAQSSAFGVEYRWMASLGVLDGSTQLAIPDRLYPSTAFMSLMAKPFVKFDSARGLRQGDITAEYFRHPDSKFGVPDAFRQPQQIRLGFRIRF